MTELINITRSSILVFEIATVLVGVYHYKKYNHTILKYIPLYFAFVSAMEILGIVLSKCSIENHWVYNMLGFVECSFILFIYYKMILSQLYKKIVLLLIILFYFIFISNFLFFQKSFLVYNTFAFTMGSLFIPGAICLFFQEMLNTERVLHLRYMLITWCSIGFLFYYICGVPLTSVINNLKSIMGDGGQEVLLFQYIAGIIMYTSIILGFIWSKKEHNY